MRSGFLLLAMSLALPAHAVDGCRATSGGTLRPLVELYTSEGCDSCPPADRWLSQQFAAASANDAVPLAFHVDYWDRLGWTDRFASPRYTARQYQAMRANRATFVYTPQVLLQGRDYPAWRGGGAPKLGQRGVAPSASIVAHAIVDARAVDVDVTVQLRGALKPSTTLAVAYVDSALSTDVKAGENRGEHLRHDHVVRVLETRELSDAATSVRLRLDRPAEAGRDPTLVAFVQHVASGDVLQTLSLPLAECAR